MRRAAILGLAIASVLAFALPADAHASLTAADPAPGSTVPTSPGSISLTFTEAPDPDLTTVEVLDVAGAVVSTGEPTLEGPDTVRVVVPDPLADGSYTVAWRVVSSADGHLTAGRYVFGVGVAPAPGEAAPADEVAGPTAGSIAAKAGLYAGLMLLIAVAGIGLGVFGGRPRSLRVVAMIAAVLALAGALGLLVTERRAIGVPMGELLASSTGRPLLWLMIVVLVADGCAVFGAAKDPWRPVLWGAGAAAAAAMWIRAGGGHAAAAMPTLPQEVLQWAHMVAAGLWIGGLLLLWLLLRERPPGAEAVPTPVREVRRFSNVAAGAVAVVVVSGVVRAFEEIGGVAGTRDLLDTTYGRVFAAKVVGATALIVMGAVNRRRSIPRLPEDDRPLRRVLTAELVVAFGVIVLTATLTSAAPNAGGGAGTGATAPASVTAAGIDFATTTSVTLALAPGAPGPSTLEAHVTDPDTGAALPADDVTLRVRSVTRPDVPAGSVPLAPQGGAWTATTSAFSIAGTWTVTAVVRTGADAVEVPLVVTTLVPGATSSVEIGPGVPTVTTTTFADGTSLQIYVDPAVAGMNQIHVTAFAADGTGAPLDDAVIVAIPDGGEPRRLQAVAFEPGHVVANAELGAGEWTVDVVATGADGAVMQATSDETIEAA